jgi:hypothetical protein
MLAFGYSGLNPADGTMVSLLTGVTSFVVGAIGGLVWIFSREKAETNVAGLPSAELSEPEVTATQSLPSQGGGIYSRKTIAKSSIWPSHGHQASAQDCAIRTFHNQAP